jgi:hypothetical protein
MDTDTRAAFDRMEHWFELLQAQYMDGRQDMQGLRADVTELRADVNSASSATGRRVSFPSFAHRSGS